MEPYSLPFEYESRFGDLKDDLGISFDLAAVLEERDRHLEDFIADFMPDLVFTHPGSLSTEISPRFYVRKNYRVDTWIASVDTVGSSQTVVVVLVNGVTAATLTIPASENKATDDTDVWLTKDEDYVQVQVTSIGAGAEDLTVQGILHR